MKITDQTLKSPTELLEVTKATYLGDFVIRITFSDGTEKAVDFKSFLHGNRHPIYEKYLHERQFKEFRLVHGNLNWNDFEMIFPIEQLYRGKIA
jgi:hypothetical protein